MNSFWKMFLGAFLALVIFSLIGIFLFVSALGSLTKKQIPHIDQQSVLVLDLSQHFEEQVQENPLADLAGSDEGDVPGLYDVVRLLERAGSDKNIAGIYVIANSNPNGFASSDEIRNALLTFKSSGKFIIAQGDFITQKAYYVANVADKLYAGPQGFVDWNGFGVDLAFVKGTLDKLGIKPQVFYAGKFKSATEPFRTDHMTPENKLQTADWLGDLYSDFLLKASETRHIDTATLHDLANEGLIQTAEDAADHKLVDGLKYDDQIKDEIKDRLNLGKFDKISFVTINKYAKTGLHKTGSGERIALIYAQGDIVDGKGGEKQIGSSEYIKLLRRARLDESIKAIVFRVNSGGGSALASEKIWRELSLAKKEKPVVVSFGDVAASGGYYISCAADSIFASPVTITGSIGVFSIVPDMQDFFNDKLGVTFDGVKTAPYANTATVIRPLTETERRMMQASVERIYAQFKERVAEGRKKDTAYINEIGQGRVWSGADGLRNGLVDRMGGLGDAVACAARMAKLEQYRLREYPEPENIFDRIFGATKPLTYTEKMKQELGEENFRIYQQMKKVQEMCSDVQTRMPFEFFIR